MGATGLSANPSDYRARLTEQDDSQIDAWAAELMRDTAIRRGVVRVVGDFRHAARLGEKDFERVFASGGGAPATLGRDAQGNLVVPSIMLHTLVSGVRSQTPDGRQRLIDYLVESFEEFVYA